ncbi:MAG TPA: ribonuclease R, partial [Geobacteraceae bacterium]
MKISKEAILRAVRSQRGEPLPFRELMQLFGVDKGRRARFKDFIDGLVDSGELVRLKGNLLTAAAGASDVIAGRLVTHRDGYGFVTPEEGGEDIFIPARFLRDNLHGDRVEVRITAVKKEGRREGRIVRTLERAVKKVVGRYEEGRGFGRVIADNQRITRDIIIPSAATGGARSGQTVVAAVTSYPLEGRPAEGKVAEVLGWPDDPAVEALTVIRKYDLPDRFPADVAAAARNVPAAVGPADLAGRTDLRGLRIVTIDGETARDFDDAVAVQREEGGRIRLWVSIADVAHYVHEGAPVDVEALKRGTSVYFPDRCIPMLPEELSNGICSLNPDVDRLTMTAEILFDKGGAVVRSDFYPSVIHSAARLTYTAVAAELAGDNAASPVEPELAVDLRLMEELALRLMARRRERGSIDFDLPEPEIVLDMQGATLAIVRSERTIAHRLIEEFMLAANEAVARFIDERHLPFLYRVHEHPDTAKLQDFAEFVKTLGHELRLEEGKVEPGEFQRLLASVEGKPEERLVNQLLLRCMKQARYAAENLGHFGLASASYTHFTSPIRRYPDLVVHRLLKSRLARDVKPAGGFKPPSVAPVPDRAALQKMAAESSFS